MRIVKIEINEFGPLSERTFSFDEAFMLIRGDNESGKSSLMLFIKFALYGFAKKVRGVTVSEAERAISRKSDSAGGSMTVLHEGKLYRIDRRVHKTQRSATEKLQVTDIETGLPVDTGASVGEYFLGIPADVFESSCSISQLSCTSVKGEQTGTAIKNLLSSADETIDAQKALATLDSARKKYLHKDMRGGSIAELREQKAELEISYRQAIEDSDRTEQIKDELAKLDKTIEDISVTQKTYEDLISQINLRTVVRLFDKLHESERDRDDTKERLSALTDKAKKGGKEPSDELVASLRHSKSEIEISKKTYGETEARHAQCRENAEKVKTENVKILEELGGIDVLSSMISAFLKKAKNASALGAVFGILFALSAAAGAALVMLSMLTVSIAAFGVSAVSAALAIIFTVSKSKARKGADELFAPFGYTSKQNDKLIAALRSELEACRTAEGALTVSVNELMIRERMLKDSLKRGAAILAPYATASDESCETLLSALDEAIGQIEAYLRKKLELSSRLSTLEERISEMSKELSDYNEHKIRAKVSEKIMNMSEAEIKDAKKSKSFCDVQLTHLTQKRSSLDRSLIERKYSVQDPFAIAARLAAIEEELAIQEGNFAAVSLAHEAISEASVKMRSTLSPKIKSLSEDYMSQLTNGRYVSLGVSDSLDISVTDDGFSYPAEAFSTGTRDTAYLAMRLSLVNILPSGEAPPILMDETLSMVDDKRTLRALSLISELCENGGQCIYFSCQDREARLCRENDIPFGLIEM